MDLKIFENCKLGLRIALVAFVLFEPLGLQAALQDCTLFVPREREAKAICEGPNLGPVGSDPIGQCLSNFARQENSASPSWAFPEGVAMRNGSWVSSNTQNQGAGRLSIIGIEGRVSSLESLRDRLLRYYNTCAPAAARNSITPESIKCCRVPAASAATVEQSDQPVTRDGR